MPGGATLPILYHMKTTLGVYLNINDRWQKELAQLADQHPELEIIGGKEAVIARIADIDLLIALPMPEDQLRRAVRLRALFVPFVGVDHLPRQLLLDRGVRVFNVHGNAEAVAERALALALASLGRVVEFHNDLCGRHEWHGFWARGGVQDGWDSLYRKRCTIFGTGAIGRELASLLHAFGCHVTGYRRRAERGVPEGFDSVAPTLAEAIAAGELLFIALPLTPETEGMFGEAELQAAQGKLIVNVGRGELIQERPLYNALRDGVLRGAALDVWFSYPADGESCHSPSELGIHTLPNVVCSPHVGGFTPSALTANQIETVATVRDFLDGRPPRNECDLNLLY